MTESQAFWPVELNDGDPDFFVCLSCLNEVFLAKVPMPVCPACQGVSTYEAFTLDSIQDWGTDELIKKAQEASREAPLPSPKAFTEESSSSADIPLTNSS